MSTTWTRETQHQGGTVDQTVQSTIDAIYAVLDELLAIEDALPELLELHAALPELLNSINIVTQAAETAEAAALQSSNSAASAELARVQCAGLRDQSEQARNAAINAMTAAEASAGLAASHASTASLSARNAEDSAKEAFDDAERAESASRDFVGAFTGDPTTDRWGKPLNPGALYYNTTLAVLRVWTGTEWVDATLAAGDRIAPRFTYRFTFDGGSAGGTVLVGVDDFGNTMDLGDPVLGLDLHHNGVMLRLNDDALGHYTIDAPGDTINLVNPTVDGDTFTVHGWVDADSLDLNGVDAALVDDLQPQFDGIETTFVLNQSATPIPFPNAAAATITLGGVVQRAGTDFATNGVTSIIFTVAPAADVTFYGVVLAVA